jgi:hypothetical protein
MNMKKSIAVLIIFVALAFPRYEIERIYPQSGHVMSVTDMGHSFLLSPPPIPSGLPNSFVRIRINTQQYIFTLLFAAGISASLLYLFPLNRDSSAEPATEKTKQLLIRPISVIYSIGLFSTVYYYQSTRLENILSTKLQITASALGQLTAMLGFSGIVYFIFRSSSKDYATRNRPHILFIFSLLTFGLMLLGRNPNQ